MNNPQNTNALSQEHEIDLSKLLNVFRIYWAWMLLIVIIFGAASATVTTFCIDKVWSTTVKFNVYIKTNSLTESTIQMTQSDYNAAETHTKSAIEILKTTECKKQLGIADRGVTIYMAKTADVPMFTVKVLSSSSTTAREVAEIIRDEFPEYVYQKTHTGLLTEIDFSGEATTPDSPNLVRNVMIACVFGFLASFVFFLLRIILDTGIHTENDVKLITNYPILGGIPSMHNAEDEGSHDYSGYSGYSGYSSHSAKPSRSDSN